MVRISPLPPASAEGTCRRAFLKSGHFAPSPADCAACHGTTRGCCQQGGHLVSRRFAHVQHPPHPPIEQSPELH
eukprot:scaffold2486_cov114-Isochrysis_galbana.AAC.1